MNCSGVYKTLCLLLELDKDITKVNGEQQGGEWISVTTFLVLFGLRGVDAKIKRLQKTQKNYGKATYLY